MSSIHVMQAPSEEGGTIYHALEDVLNTLSALESEFAPLVGGQLFFLDETKQKLTPFAARLFRKGYVSVERSVAHPGAMAITAVQPEIERRLMKVLGPSAEEETTSDGIVVSEADLPFVGRLGALSEEARAGNRKSGAAGRPGDHPLDLLENLLYGATPKDDPEGGHHGEHEISDGVDRS